MLVNNGNLAASLLEWVYLILHDTRVAGIQMYVLIYVSKLIYFVNEHFFGRTKTN